MDEPLWRELDGVQGAFALVVGRTIVRRTDQRDEVPGYHTAGYDEFEAVLFDDGSWLAIEYRPGERAHSTWSPATPGYCEVWYRAPITFAPEPT